MAEEETTEKFTIGEFTFETFHEYRDAQEDVKKIDLINRELDIHDPEVAVRLYNMIRTGEIVFKSPIGEQFFNHVADIVADRSVGLLEDRAVVNEAEDKAKGNKILGIAIIALAVVAFAYFGITQLNEYVTTRRLAQLQDSVTADSELDTESKYDQTIKSDDGVIEKDAYIDPSTLTVLPEYQELYEENNDFVGWISIADTSINYPVMQSDDNDYYLRRDFDGNSDTNGTIFVDYRSDIVNQTTNTILYGHNMNSGLMFAPLKGYLTEDFYNEHKTIVFNTIYEYREYEVVAVCLSEVEYQDQETFRYYNFIDATTTSEWDDFYRNIQAMNVYGTDIDLTSSDKILTLSTCNSYTEDGRLFIVAKRIK